MLSVHTSPLAQPGTGDAGGLNVYVVETARRLAEQGTEVEIFTRATTSELPPTVPLAPGVLVRHIPAGPFEGLSKNDLPGLLCAFAAGVLRVEACHEAGWYDLVHSHYWLSGQVGWLAADRWNVPLVHTMHTMAKFKNASLASGDVAEPVARVIGEEQVVAASDRLLANTEDEARQLVGLYDADPRRVAVVPPGVDLSTFSAGGRGSRRSARRRLGLPPDAQLLLFVGRIQPLKAPDVLVTAAAELLARNPARRSQLRVAVLGGPSGSGLDRPEELQRLAAEVGIADLVRFTRRCRVRCWLTGTGPPTWWRCPRNESFGLVALGPRPVRCRWWPPGWAACGRRSRTASRPTLDGHEPGGWARAIEALLDDEPRLHQMRSAAVAQARQFSWDVTVGATLEVYARALADHRRRRIGALAAAPDPRGAFATAP
jgi:D-inositol-3-phosphate glycosyltransferase